MQNINSPKVSVCMVTYNQEKYIRQCLQSIIDQKTNFDFEVLVSDDCSTDSTRKIILEFASNYPKIVKPRFRERNVGALENFVLIHNAARSEYVAHCDGDDLFLPNNPLKVLPTHSEKLADAFGASFSESADTIPPSLYAIARLLFSFPS